MSARDLARFFTEPGGFPRLSLRQAIVTSAIASPASVSITIAGSAVEIEQVRYLSSYSTPTLGDTVWVLQNGPDLLVLGTLAT